MRRSPLLTATLVLAAAAVFCCGIGGVAAAVDTVADSCNAIRNIVDFDFCVSRLRAVPGSESVDRQGHVLMATDLATMSGAIAWDAATRMARRESDQATRDALEACRYLYWASMPALRMFRGYVAAQSWGTDTSLTWLMEQAGIGCDAALEGEDTTASKMARANREFNQLCTMAEAISVARPAFACMHPRAPC